MKYELKIHVTPKGYEDLMEAWSDEPRWIILAIKEVAEHCTRKLSSSDLDRIYRLIETIWSRRDLGEILAIVYLENVVLTHPVLGYKPLIVEIDLTPEQEAEYCKYHS